MKQSIIKCKSLFRYASLGMLVLLLTFGNKVVAQSVDNVSSADGNQDTVKVKKRPVKNTFESNMLIDNQTVMVPVKGTLEFDIQHRFGIVNNGYTDFYGLFAPPIIRIGFEYVPIRDLQLGVGLCSNNMQLDLNGKYALLKQKKGGMPVSITYYGNIAIDTRAASNFVTSSDRYSYFDQLMVARKVTSNFSVQAAMSLSYFNNVPGYVNANGEISNTVQNAQFTLSFMGRYKLTEKMAILVDYDQPLTQNYTNNPRPNLAFGLEITTSSHCFQIIAGNCQYILPQDNAMYNQNDLSKGQYLLGFNMTKLWNF